MKEKMMSDINLSKMTKAKLVEYGDSIGITLETKLTKAVMIEQLSVPQPSPEEKRRNDALAMLAQLANEARMEL
jgi:hypothetical protein